MSCSVVFFVLLVFQRHRIDDVQVGCDFIHVFRYLVILTYILMVGKVAINISSTDIQQFFHSIQREKRKISSWNAAEKYLSLMFNVIYWVENFYFPAREGKIFLHWRAAKYAKITNAFWNMSGYANDNSWNIEKLLHFFSYFCLRATEEW